MLWMIDAAGVSTKINLLTTLKNTVAFLLFNNSIVSSCFYLGYPSYPHVGPEKYTKVLVWKRHRPQSHVGVTVFMLECISSIFSGSPSHHHTNPALSPLIATETSDTEITTTEIIKRRDVGPYGIRSEYCIRKIICPLGVPETPKG